MAKYACLHRLSKASETFSKEFGRKVTYTTIQSMVTQYKHRLEKVADPCSISSLEQQPRGRSTLLPTDLDQTVCQHLRGIRAAGGVISRRITIATANGIVSAQKPPLLRENGGYIDFSIG